MVPNQVTDATAEHREDMDMVRRFLSEACETEPPATSKLRTPVKYLYAAWEHWRKGKSAPPYTERDFAQKLEGMGFPYKDTSTVGRVRVGIRLLEHAYPEGKEEGEPEAVTVRQNGKVLQPGDLS